VSRDLIRRLATLEARRSASVPRYVILWGNDRDPTPESSANLVQVAWVRPEGTTILALPHNGRDPLAGCAA
jgi:hypothetical protein